MTKVNLSHVSDESPGTKPLNIPHTPELGSHQYTLMIQKTKKFEGLKFTLPMVDVKNNLVTVEKFV